MVAAANAEKRAWTPAEVLALRRLKAEGLSYTRIATAIGTGRSPASVSSKAKMIGLADEIDPGAEADWRRLIVRYHSRGYSDLRISKLLGCAVGTVSYHRRRLGIGTRPGNKVKAAQAVAAAAERAAATLVGWPPVEGNARLVLEALEEFGRPAGAGEVAARNGARSVRQTSRIIATLLRQGHVVRAGCVNRHPAYALAGRTLTRRLATDFVRRKLPPEPTDHPPGSPKKVEVMRSRHARGYRVHHPDDARR